VRTFYHFDLPGLFFLLIPGTCPAFRLCIETYVRLSISGSGATVDVQTGGMSPAVYPYILLILNFTI
jgi:hypothetical protein